MVLRGYSLSPGTGRLQHAVDTSHLRPKKLNGNNGTWVQYALTDTPITKIPNKCPLAACCRPDDVLMSKHEAEVAGLDNWAVGGHFKNAFEFSTGTYYFFSLLTFKKFIGKFRI